MKTNRDARYLLNKKRLKGPTLKKSSHGILDARSILNSKKLVQKSRLVSAHSGASFSRQRSFSSRKKSTPMIASTSRIAAHEKQVKVSRDGNIVITAKSKNTSLSTPCRIPRWTPSDVDTANVEHLGIDDVLDMDSLPSAPLGMNNALPSRSKSLAEEMRNTMIADQVSTQESLCINVCNLHASVSIQDIMELFGDVGIVKRAEMTRPGFAVVEFFDPSDAVRACELYHQRLLDGQPMMCQIQPQTSQRSLISQRLGERVESRVPLVNSRSIRNPQNVRFTVKLS